jgi:hypothetical protein
METRAEELLRHARTLKKEMQAFVREARDYLRLQPESPEDELEDPETDLLGTMECLLTDDLEPALKKLDELDGLLRRARS